MQWNLSIKDTLGPPLCVLITEVSSIQRSFYILQYYTGTQNGVLNIEVFLIQRFVIERSHCIMYLSTCMCSTYMCVCVCLYYVTNYVCIFLLNVCRNIQ